MLFVFFKDSTRKTCYVYDTDDFTVEECSTIEVQRAMRGGIQFINADLVRGRLGIHFVDSIPIVANNLLFIREDSNTLKIYSSDNKCSILRHTQNDGLYINDELIVVYSYYGMGIPIRIDGSFYIDCFFSGMCSASEDVQQICKFFNISSRINCIRIPVHWLLNTSQLYREVNYSKVLKEILL